MHIYISYIYCEAGNESERKRERGYIPLSCWALSSSSSWATTFVAIRANPLPLTPNPNERSAFKPLAVLGSQ